jgi:hypothetical protein
MKGSPTAIVFSGHMIDAPTRPTPRFPPHCEALAAREIAAWLAKLPHETVGYASAARGGDILFHEAMRARGRRTVIILPFAPRKFKKTSVSGVPGGTWVARFRRLWSETPKVDQISLNLPVESTSYAICNAEILTRAAFHGRFKLLALWDGQPSQDPGGTGDMVQRARSMGALIEIIRIGDLMA